jgi:hypothetical protein
VILGQQGGFLPPSLGPLPVQFGVPTAGHSAALSCRVGTAGYSSGRRNGLRDICVTLTEDDCSELRPILHQEYHLSEVISQERVPAIEEKVEQLEFRLGKIEAARRNAAPDQSWR